MTEIRKITKTSGQRTVFVTLPIKLCDELGFKAGDYVKILTDGNKTIALEKVEI
jgi:antitoxin component of MazEF toxin-antitoxin module